MIFSYLKSTFRNFRKYKLYSLINVTGLAIAVALGILIYLYIRDELSYDGFHSRKDRIYRIEAKQFVYGDSPHDFPLEKDHSFRFCWMPTPLAPVLKDEIPDIVEFSRYSDDEGILSKGDKAFNEKIIFVDPGFLKMFDFNMPEGNPNQALNDIHNLVLTQSLAKKYFGDEDPVGKTLTLNLWNNSMDAVITGIVTDPPGNSSFQFSILARQEIKPFYKESLDSWNSFNTPTFLLLAGNTDMHTFHARLMRFTDKYFGKTIQDERSRQKLGNTARIFELTLNRLDRVHLDKNVPWYGVSDIAYSYILGGIGILIFIIACLNYISLSISNAAGRSVEIGIRKVLGAGPFSLARRFWGESQILSLISVFLGMLIAVLLIDPFNRFAGKNLSLFYSGNLSFIVFLVLMAFLVGLMAGGYPALFLSGFRPLDVLKKKKSGRYNLTFTRGMVVVQYALSGILITSSLVMFRQMRFVATANLGFNKDQVLVFPTYTGWTDEGERLAENLKNELLQSRDVLSVAGTNFSFNRGGWSKNGFEIQGKEHYAYVYRVDPDYV